MVSSMLIRSCVFCVICVVSIFGYGKDVIVDDDWSALKSGDMVNGNYIIDSTAFSSISKAIKAVSMRNDSNVTVQVNAGEYAMGDQDNFLHVTFPVWLKGAGKNVSIFRGQLVNIVAPHVKVSGFSILSPAGAEGIRVSCEDDTVIIENNEISAPYAGIGSNQNNNCYVIAKKNDLHGSQVGICNIKGLITDNDIHDNSRWGILDAGGIIENNRIYHNVEEGILYSHANAVVRNNSISQNGKSGISGMDGNTSITGNVINNNGENGIVGWNDNTIINNTIAGNKFNGIRYTNAKMAVINNIIFSNDLMGIEGDRTTHASILYNNVFNNKAGNYYDTLEVGAGNISCDPLFVNNESDFHLQKTSPCIGAGMVVDSQMEGLTGLATPIPQCTYPDIGAFEDSLGVPLNGSIFKASANILSFDSVPQGNTVSRQLVIRNMADDTLRNGLLSVTNTAYAINVMSGSLKMCDSLIVSIVFTPKDTLSHQDTLFVDHPHQAGVRLKIPLSGCGTKLSLMPSAFQYDFVKTGVGSSSVWRVRLFNNDSQSARVVSFSSTRREFSLAQQTATIAPLDSFFLDVKFTPYDTLTYTGYIHVIDETISDRIFSILLAGTGRTMSAGVSSKENSAAPFIYGIDSKYNLHIRCSKKDFISIAFYQIDGKKIGPTMSRHLAVGEHSIPLPFKSVKTSRSLFLLTITMRNGQSPIKKIMSLR
jgi:Right handed beta helix region